MLSVPPPSAHEASRRFGEAICDVLPSYLRSWSCLLGPTSSPPPARRQHRSRRQAHHPPLIALKGVRLADDASSLATAPVEASARVKFVAVVQQVRDD